MHGRELELYCLGSFGDSSYRYLTVITALLAYLEVLQTLHTG